MIDENGTDDYLEMEFAVAPKTLTSDLYHYTSSDAAILGILANRSLRLAPFQGTNDLWESRPMHPNLEGEHDEADTPAFLTQTWESVDRHIRGFSKVACFTQDWVLPQSVMQPDALRGWAHLSLWAHYGAHHTGVCLRFDREKLLAAFDRARESAVHHFVGPVSYRNAEFGVGPYPISLEQAAEFGIDAVALRYANVHHERIFFRKHADWASESEFRLVRTDLSTQPFYLDISDALTGVILGDAFAPDRLPALHQMLGGLGDVEVLQASFNNRKLSVWSRSDSRDSEVDVNVSTQTIHSAPSRRPGSLAERLALLNDLDETAARNKAAAVPAAAQVLEIWREGLRTQPWLHGDTPDLVFSTYESVTAIPPKDRQNRPGVPGEVIAHQTGLMVVGEHQPQPSFTWVTGLAVQILPDGTGRLHASIETEEWKRDGNVRRELYRDSLTVDGNELVDSARELLERLSEAIPAARSDYDQLRGRPAVA